MEEAWKRVWGSVIHIIIASPWKNTFWKMPLHVFFYKKIQKEAFWGVQEARKEEDLGPHIPAPETRTNLCSFAKRFMKINQKNSSPKALASSKTAAPFYSGSASTLTSFLSSGSVRKCPNFFSGNPFVFGVLQDRVSSRARHCQQDDCSKHGFLKLAQPDPLNWTIVHCKYCY